MTPARPPARVATAQARGCLGIGFGGSHAEWEFVPPSTDPHVRQELIETLYHVLWELVHVFFDHRGLLEGRSSRAVHDAGASSFLYPFLDEREHELEPVVEDVRRSALMKSEEIGALRIQTLTENRDALIETATALSTGLERGGKLLAFGNGGSATDAMDVVADFHTAGHGGRTWPAIDLTEDAAILTAIANDVGLRRGLSRQVIAHGIDGDVLLAISTSGGSRNVIEALASPPPGPSHGRPRSAMTAAGWQRAARRPRHHHPLRSTSPGSRRPRQARPRAARPGRIDRGR